MYQKVVLPLNNIWNITQTRVRSRKRAADSSRDGRDFRLST